MILKVVVEFLAIKIFKGFGKTRVGIDDENINLHRDIHKIITIKNNLECSVKMLQRKL